MALPKALPWRSLKTRYTFPSRRNVNLAAIITAISLTGTIIIYYLAIKTQVDVAQFYAFNAAFAIVCGAFKTLVPMIEPAAQIAPTFELIRPVIEAAPEIAEDKPVIEKLSGGIVRGMSYPFGTHSPSVVEALTLSGMEYSRTTRATMGFDRPENFMLWDPSCHHRDCLALIDKFEESERTRAYALAGALLYVWGHSFEFDNNKNWDLIETFCQRIGGRPDFWYATNIEIVDYLEAQRALRFSKDLTRVFNPSAVPVWIRKDSDPVMIAPGETRAL